MGLSATSSQSPSREGALAADNGVGRRWRPVGDEQQARGRVSNGTSQAQRTAAACSRTLGGGGSRVARGCTMAVAGGSGLCSKRRREDREERATRGEGAARKTPGEKQRQGSEQRAGQDTAERAVDAAVLWMRAERRCQVLARFKVPVRVLAPSRPRSPPDSTIDDYRLSTAAAAIATATATATHRRRRVGLC